MLNKISGVIFGLNGVLVETMDWHFQALNLALNDVAGITISEQENKTVFMGMPTRTKLQILETQGKIGRHSFEDVFRQKQLYMAHIIEERLEMMPEKIVLHKRLNDLGIKSACVTNTTREIAVRLLDGTGQRNYLDTIIAAGDVRNPKPHSEGHVRAMVILQTTPDRTLIVEDSLKGVQAAQNTGSLVLKVNGAVEVTWEHLEEYLK